MTSNEEATATLGNTSIDESIMRAKAIAAKLLSASSTEQVGKDATTTAAPAATSSSSSTTTSKPKRKRWAVDESAAAVADTTAITYKSMELPSDIIASAVAAATSVSSNSDQVQIYPEEGEDPTKKRSKSTYTPQPVAQILGLVPNASSDNATAATSSNAAGGTAYYGPGSDGTTPSTTALIALNTEPMTLHEEHIYCPNGIVGYIIGRGGEAITSMQRTTGCKVQIQKEFEMQAQNMKERKITLIAADLSQIEACKSIIMDMIEERTRQLTSGSSSSSQTASAGMGGGSTTMTGEEKVRLALAQGHALLQIPVPTEHIGLVIGKAGSNLKMVQDRTGAHVQIPPTPDVDNPSIRTCNITCPTMEGAIEAKRLITEILDKNVRLSFAPTSTNTRIGGGPGIGAADATTVEGGGHTISVAIPDKDVGIIIGRGGCVIRELQNKSQARIQIPSQPTPGQTFRIATVTGTPEACQQAQSMIERVIMDQSSQSVMSGITFRGGASATLNPTVTASYYGQPQQQLYGAAAAAYGQQQYAYPAQQQQQQQQPQKDYTAEWAAYYAAQAAATATAATPTAVNTTTSGDATATAAAAIPTDPTAYYADFWKYAEYYGEDAARLYYGAWSPPVGSINPNTASKQPHIDVTASINTSAGTTSAAISTAKDTSVRNVSNLPAWMTNQG